MIYLQNQDGEIEYVFEDDKLRRSSGSPWSKEYQNTVCGEIRGKVDNFIVEIEDYELELDASSLANLYYLLGCFVKTRHNLCEKLDILTMEKTGEL